MFTDLNKNEIWIEWGELIGFMIFTGSFILLLIENKCFDVFEKLGLRMCNLIVTDLHILNIRMSFENY